MPIKIDDQGKKSLKIVGAIVLIATILFFSVGCSYFNKKMELPNDHPAEEVLEEVIDSVLESHIGIDPDIDLTHDDDPNKVYPEAEE